MKTRVFALIIVTILLVSCKKEQEKPALGAAKSVSDTATTQQVDTVAKKPVNSIWGYRFVIGGDFDGDGKPENLVEHYYSRRDKKESYKFYDNVEEDWLVWDSIMKKRPYSFALPDNKNIDTLRISKEKQLYGIAYLKNEGDLNGDGTDEVSYVINYADISGMNTCYIVTYKNKKWQELYSFATRDWEVPELPGDTVRYKTLNNGTYGNTENVSSPKQQAEDAETEKALRAFPGLIKKLGKNIIEVTYVNEDAESVTKVVTLKSLR